MKRYFLLLLALSSISCSSLLTQQSQIGYVKDSNIKVPEKTVDLKELFVGKRENLE